ncbi:MAG: hypothetical protein K2X03_05945 [Bryobacteraceae bacterium]|nr:hypothetical protein [Bryobacteraceae bacterium]
MLSLLLCAVLADESAWDKVRAVEPGAELRIYRRAVKEPVVAKLDEATEDHLIIVLRDEQIAIRRAEIDRIDRRPRLASGRVAIVPRKMTRVNPSEQGQPVVQGTSASTALANAARTDTLSIRSKPPFEFLYRRPTSLPKQE